MKNKETTNKSTVSRKSCSTAQRDDMQMLQQARSKTITKSQINRLKKFYNTTRWLPNSSFTTFFGKPAFENYGFGNTKPVYGGLFYGNYMLSHNINPIDGDNFPGEKQVYASAMHKSRKYGKQRRPEPPRKVPDEIRNTPEELTDLRGRNPIFQQNNKFPSKGINKPNLVRAKYFRSPKGTPKKSCLEDLSFLNEEFDIEGLIDGKDGFKKKKKVKRELEDVEFFTKNKKSGKMKDDIKNKNDDYLQSKMNFKSNNKLTPKNNNEGDNVGGGNNGNTLLGVKSNKQQPVVLLENPSSSKHQQQQFNIVKSDKSMNIKELSKEEKEMTKFYEKMLCIDKRNQISEKETNQNNQNEGGEASPSEKEANNEHCVLCKTQVMAKKKKDNPCLVPAQDLQ